MVLFLMYFFWYFTFLLKQLRRLYIGGFIFQVPLVSDYSTWCTNAYLRVRCTSLLFTRSVYQPPTRKVLTNQGEVHQYIDYVVCFIQSTVIIIQISIQY